jgi:hypothetical protein
MVLRTVAMVLGIIGGVYGLIGGSIITAFISSSSNISLIYKGIALLLALIPPITGVMGAAIVRNKPLLGSSLMGGKWHCYGGVRFYRSPYRLSSCPASRVFSRRSNSRSERESSELDYL